MANETYLESKPRYEILDGLRGVAAVLVVVFHLFETYAGGPAHQVINHGYLAVDFFFALSGFVVGYAYDDRWGKMGVWSFFKRRLVRLHPMVLAGTVVGACFFYLGQGPLYPLMAEAPAWKVALAFVMGCLMIPCGPKMDIRGWGETNTFNGPNWSLTWEYVANILYALIFRRLPAMILAALAVAAAFCTIDLCLNLNTFGLLTEGRNAQIYTVIGGWMLTPEQIYIGLTRLLYPFICGLVVSRIGKFIEVDGGFWWCSFIIVAIFSIPCVGGEGNILNGIYNAVCIIVLFPIVLMMGAGSRIEGKKSVGVCKFLGELSYPLYITHYPLMYLQMNWAATNADAPASAHIMVSAGVFVMAIAMAYGWLKLYDIPVRKWLTDNWLKSKSKKD